MPLRRRFTREDYYEQRLLEVYREPMPDPVALLGFSHARTERLDPGAAISPLAAPEAVLQVESLLPLAPLLEGRLTAAAAPTRSSPGRHPPG